MIALITALIPLLLPMVEAGISIAGVIPFMRGGIDSAVNGSELSTEDAARLHLLINAAEDAQATQVALAQNEIDRPA